MVTRVVLIGVLCLHAVLADVYLHNLRGSNNRLNERSANRRNANRMFDSQNNNRGGYNVGDRTDDPAGNDADDQYQMEFFMSDAGKSYMDIEWTNQHGCGGNEDADPHKQNCNLVMQYMCQPESVRQDDDDKIRPGTDTNTQNHNRLNGNQVNTETLNQKENRKSNNVQENRGLNEPWEWYDKCYNRERNKGLFTADQILKNNNGQGISAAIYTRQNPNGNRYGYECPEERDYFPYFHPTPWVDIAVLTDNTSMCEYYAENSFNTNPKGECVQNYPNSNRKRHFSRYNNPAECAENDGEWVDFYNFIEKDATANNQAACESKTNAQHTYVWGVPFDPYDTIGTIQEECLVQPKPIECAQAPWSRSNHLGNGREGKANTYKWELPNFPSGTEMRCVYRMRYNISTDDYAPWATNSSFNKDLQAGVVSPVQQNPYVDIGADVTALRLAINTAQFGRTFQDRSHPFILKERPDNARTETIHNINVRGKRGNIVQVYPAVEYDFVPNDLEIKEGDLIHMQWTGSNTHNNGNPGGDGQTGDAGEGRGGTDRSNIVQIANRDENFPMPFDQTNMWENAEIVWSPYKLNNNQNPSAQDLAINMASSGYYRCMESGDCGNQSVDRKQELNNLLDNAPASYEGPLMKVKKGTYHYTCTRNNNFTNRSQKATLIVS